MPTSRSPASRTDPTRPSRTADIPPDVSATHRRPLPPGRGLRAEAGTSIASSYPPPRGGLGSGAGEESFDADLESLSNTAMKALTFQGEREVKVVDVPKPSISA